MSDTEEAMRLTKTEKWYAKTALDRLAQTYDEEGKAPNAVAVRNLAARVEAHHTERRPYKTEDVVRWHERMAQCQGDPQKTRAVMREWWVELCLVAVDPAGTLADAMFPFMDQGIQQGVQQGIGQILFTIEQKMMAVVANIPQSDLPEPERSAFYLDQTHKAIDLILEFVKLGRQQLAANEPLWRDDPHLAAIAKQMQAQQGAHPPQ